MPQLDLDFSKSGALPDHMMLIMYQGGAIKNLIKNKEGQATVNPASFDLSVKSLYRVDGFLPPKPGQSVLERMKEFGATPHDPNIPLAKGGVYLAEMEQTIRLQTGVWGIANPKSSTGRAGAHVQLVTDSSPRYERIAEGYDGPLWLVIRPLAFNVLVKPGEALAQVRLLTGKSLLDQATMIHEADTGQFIWPEGKKEAFKKSELQNMVDAKGTLMLRAGLFGPENHLFGFVSNGTPKPFDLSARRQYHRKEFFDDVVADKYGRALIKKDHFYLLSSRERVRVPPGFACGMVAVHEEFGEFRSHYAGFIDPGYGEGESADGFIGRTLTLEVTAPYECFIEEGQPVAGLIYERMLELPTEHYDQKPTSNYRLQVGPTFSKHFIAV